MLRDHRTTPVRGDLPVLLERQLRLLLRLLPKARRGDPEDVHRARVATRRLREMLPVTAHAAGWRGCDRIARDVRRITRALGPVREIDVALTELELDSVRFAAAGTVAPLADHLGDEREGRVRGMRVHLDRVARKALAERVRALALAAAEGERAWRPYLGARLRKRGLGLSDRLHRVGTMYAAGPIHDVRIAAKKLRYTIELAHAAAGVACRPEIASLRHLQDVLGRLRDLQVLQDHLRSVLAAMTDRAAVTALGNLDADLEIECRALHAAFLRRLPLWQRIADHAAGPLPAALIVSRMVKMVPAAAHPATRKASA